LLACLLDDLSIILLDGCEEFETFTYIVFQDYFFSVRTDLLYWYRFFVSYYLIVIFTVLIA